MPRYQTKRLRSSKNDLDELLFEILSNIAAILVSTGYGFARVNRLTKIAFVRAADSAEFESDSRLSIARIAALTGLTRTDVSQIVRQRNNKTSTVEGPTNRVARVAIGWATDKKYSQEGRRPRQLEFAGPGNSFTALVRQYSGDIPPKAMLTEMVRLGMARRNSRDRLVLIRSDAVQSRVTTDALKAAIPLISFLARASTAQADSELTSRSDRIELRFSTMPQLFAAMRELHGRHSAFVAAIKELGNRRDGQSHHAINVSVAVAATNSRASSSRRLPSSITGRSRTGK